MTIQLRTTEQRHLHNSIERIKGQFKEAMRRQNATMIALTGHRYQNHPATPAERKEREQLQDAYDQACYDERKLVREYGLDIWDEVMHELMCEAEDMRMRLV